MISCNRRVLLPILLGLGLASPLAAQISDSDARELARLPGPPADHILDVAEIFKRHPDRYEEISRRLRRLHEEHDLPVYLAIYAGILDSNLNRRSRLLYDKWIGPDRDGVVVVYESDTRGREIVTPSSKFANLEESTGRLSRLPDYQMIPILAELQVTLEGVEDRVDFLDRTTEILAVRLDALMKEKPAGIGDRSNLKLVAVTLAIGVALTLLGVLGNRRLRVVEENARERFYFPDVTVGARLGAPFCGGCQSIVDFSSNRSTPSE